MRYHSDGRRDFWGDIFNTAGGDINIVILEHAMPIAWHRHQQQDDQIFLVRGIVLIQTIDPDGQRHEWNLSEDHRGPAFIPRNWWHGYEGFFCDGEPTILLQFNGPGKWDGTDEYRHPIDDEMPWNLPTP